MSVLQGVDLNLALDTEGDTVNEENATTITQQIKLDMQGHIFTTDRSTLLCIEGTYFHAMLSSGVWLPNKGDAFAIDCSPDGFDRIFECLCMGHLSLEGLSEHAVQCVMENIDYFQIPSVACIWEYSTSTVLLPPMYCRVDRVFLLPDGNILGHDYFNDKELIVPGIELPYGADREDCSSCFRLLLHSDDSKRIARSTSRE